MGRYPAERISVFDIFKIGVGPSSSHTMGPWHAARRFVNTLVEVRGERVLPEVRRVEAHLYGSLAKTGKGHGTDVAIVLGLEGRDPETEDVTFIAEAAANIRRRRGIGLAVTPPGVEVADSTVAPGSDGGRHDTESINSTESREVTESIGSRRIDFDYERDILFHRDRMLDYHPNGLEIVAELAGGAEFRRTYFSIGGGFVVEEGVDASSGAPVTLPYPVDTAEALLGYCRDRGVSCSEIVRANMEAWHGEKAVCEGLGRIADIMCECVWHGIRASDMLPGGLGVHRRAPRLARTLLGDPLPESPEALVAAVSRQARRVSEAGGGFEQVTRWVSCFALAVNEQNAGFGRIVTAPTNGAAGVIPAVLLYYRCFVAGADREGIERFLLVAGDVGSLFKKGATISAAMGGCQAEIGVSSAMAAAGLAEISGGSPEQVMQAAEIAMEHHLGMTCDPVGGLVQIPCIERNTMGAIKAITAANIALAGDPAEAVVSLDRVIETMWDTALDMSSRYKETSEGGLAAHIPINVVEC